MPKAGLAPPRRGQDFSRIPVHPPGAGALQPKLAINKPGDACEQQAGLMAERVMGMPATQPQRISSQPPAQIENQGPRQLKRASVGDAGQAAAPHCVHEVLRSHGQPLDPAARAFMEPRFGHDFSKVRVHSGAAAEQSARAVNAHAYTVGQNIVFGAGMFAPATAGGRRLLAHELTHVVQQEGHPGASVIQRAEVDDRSCAGLNDAAADIDAEVNTEIADERKGMDKPIFAPLLSLHVMQRLGGRSAISPIETFVENLPATKRRIPPNDLSGTKYSGAENVNKFYKFQTLGVAHVVGSVVKIHGLCIGADKLGHFFDQGYDYFSATPPSGSKTADTANIGRAMEIGQFGLAATGVFSNADQVANHAGMQFYKDLEKDPDKYKFSIKNYITDQWNEQSNPSFYEPQIGGVVWGNLLTGKWQGTFTPAAGGTAVNVTFSLAVPTPSSVTGTFQLQAQSSPDKPKDVTIKSGTIRQKTSKVSATAPDGSAMSADPVSGISIEFDWERAGSSGKGQLDSVNEQTLSGTLGVGSAAAGSGVFKLKKI